ncbi:hypothetical protein, partial [Vibrio cholerae]|uniref:hypothetical protein n=1 Tax=Vibrio cholerae TaxID=666 RepID=UPI003F685344
MKMIVVPIVISSLIVGIAGFALSTSSPWVLVVSYVRPCSLITSRRARISE